MTDYKEHYRYMKNWSPDFSELVEEGGGKGKEKPEDPSQKTDNPLTSPIEKEKPDTKSEPTHDKERDQYPANQ